MVITLARYIQLKREAKGWSQRDLAKRTGFSPTTIQKIESGITKHPGIDVIFAIAKALNIPTGNLILAYRGIDPDEICQKSKVIAKEEVLSLLSQFIDSLPEEN